MISVVVPVLPCFRCNSSFIPKIDIKTLEIQIPEMCPKSDCRAKSWNIPNDELELLKQKNNLIPKVKKIIKVKIIEKYDPSVKSNSKVNFCKDCELFFPSENGLERHNARRHNGLCHKCKSSNVTIKVIDGISLCSECRRKLK